ncbi:hypothetical protein RJ639_033992, partial [Escallonia herrerae]
MESKTTAFLPNLLQSCIDNKAYVSGKTLHARILRIGRFVDTFLSNRLIEFYYKCGHINTARHVFDKMPQKNIYSCNAMLAAYCKERKTEDAYQMFVEMPERNEVSWNTLISALVRNGCEHRGLDVYYRMNREGFVPTRFTLTSVLSACGALVDVECGRGCHGVATKFGLDINMYVGNALLSMYAKCGRIEDAIQAFGDLPEPNEVAFTAMIGGLLETDRVEEAYNMFRLMQRFGIQLDPVSLSSVLGVCTRRGAQSDGFACNMNGQQIHGLSIKLGFASDLHLNNSLLDLYAKNGDMDCAEAIFSKLPEPSVVSWNVMIGGYGQKYQINKAVEYMNRMQNHGFEPDEVTYINMLAACVKSGDIETGRQLFDRMASPSLSSWNAILSGYSQNENHVEALRTFREMQFRNVHADRTTLAIVLSSCAAMGLLEDGKQVHAVSLKALFHTDVYVASGLIGMYSKCNKTEMAKCIFGRMSELDVVCWNSMIAGLTLDSFDEEAFTFYKKMLGDGMYPTEFSYTTILRSCSKLHSGLVDHGLRIFNSMQKYGSEPLLEHYTCIIDSLGRAGRFQEVEAVLDKMPYNDDPVVWEVLLSSCRVHANVSLAKRAAEELFLLDPQNSAPYVLLANMYSSLGRWDDAKEVRKMMVAKRIIKDP